MCLPHAVVSQMCRAEGARLLYYTKCGTDFRAWKTCGQTYQRRKQLYAVEHNTYFMALRTEPTFGSFCAFVSRSESVCACLAILGGMSTAFMCAYVWPRRGLSYSIGAGGPPDTFAGGWCHANAPERALFIMASVHTQTHANPRNSTKIHTFPHIYKRIQTFEQNINMRTYTDDV